MTDPIVIDPDAQLALVALSKFKLNPLKEVQGVSCTAVSKHGTPVFYVLAPDHYQNLVAQAKGNRKRK